MVRTLPLHLFSSFDLSVGVGGKKITGDYAAFAKINALLLNAPTPLKNIPVRIYMPSSPTPTPSSPDAGADATPGSFRVMQTLIAPRLPNSKSSPRRPPSRALFFFLFELNPLEKEPRRRWASLSRISSLPCSLAAATRSWPT